MRTYTKATIAEDVEHLREWCRTHSPSETRKIYATLDAELDRPMWSKTQRDPAPA